MRLLVPLVAAALCLPRPAAAQHEGHGSRGSAGGRPPAVLGSVAFRNSGAPAAQEPLQRGVALLHSCEYEGAAAAFREAQRADPRLAAAYWLEALTYSHVMWGEEDLPAARTALARLAPTPEARLARAAVAARRGDRDGAIALLREVADAETANPGLPPAVDPLHERLGTLLLEAGRPAEAAASFERALAARPNRSAALLGLARARAAAGDAAGASEAAARLRANWRRADPDVAALAPAR